MRIFFGYLIIGEEEKEEEKKKKKKKKRRREEKEEKEEEKKKKKKRGFWDRDDSGRGSAVIELGKVILVRSIEELNPERK